MRNAPTLPADADHTPDVLPVPVPAPVPTPEPLEVVPVPVDRVLEAFPVPVPDVLPAVPAVVAEPMPTVLEAQPVRRRRGLRLPEAIPVRTRGFFGFVFRVLRFIGSVCEWLFGVVCLIVGLSVLAAVPVAQFLSLGYLLEAAGRVARSGRLRDGFFGQRIAARAGGLVLGTWLMLLPLRIVSSLWLSAQVIEPDGRIARNWRLGLTILTVLMVIHIVAACSRGGKLRYFFWPFNLIWLVRRLWRGGYYAEARDATWDFVQRLRLPYYFWLGLRGFGAAFVWLALPVTMLAVGRQAPIVGFLGALLLTLVIMHLPFLQMHFAARNRFAATFDVLGVWVRFFKAPLAFAIASLITLAFAVPLYLLKIEMIPREAAWLVSLFFVVSIFPARLLTGWAYGLAERRQLTLTTWPMLRLVFLGPPGLLLILMTAVTYVIIVFFTQYTAWNGIWSLYEQHAFMLPVPFMGM